MADSRSARAGLDRRGDVFGQPPLPRSFFEQSPEACARELVGCTLVWGDCVGRIVETEAYAAEGDAACHTAVRPSARQFIQNHPAGVAYVYLNYGIHWMLNFLVKGPEGDGFVLLRALEPRVGLEAMRERRQREVLTDLCSGPGKLGQALALSGADHGRDLCGLALAPRASGRRPSASEFGSSADGSGSPVCVLARRPAGAAPSAAGGGSGDPDPILACARIGIRVERERPWRFLLKGSPFVSVPPPRSPPAVAE